MDFTHQSQPSTSPQKSKTESKTLETLAREHQADRNSDRIRVKNRRKRYLDTHPTYFTSPSLEFADPFLYEELVGRFIPTAEKEAVRRTANVQNNHSNTSNAGEASNGGPVGGEDRVADLSRGTELAMAKEAVLANPDPNSPLLYKRRADGGVIATLPDQDDRVQDREEGLAKWQEVMTLRFLRGADEEFEYESVDTDRGLDDWEREDREDLEKWLDEEGEEFVGEGSPKGQTGVQDF
ncbi:hypothetical protein MBLNU230_g6822t1 [Neophaeotheca triangularis]